MTFPFDKEERNKMARRMLDKLIMEFDSCGLTEWEQGFVRGIEDRLDMGGALTDRQCEILERIHDRF